MSSNLPPLEPGASSYHQGEQLAVQVSIAVSLKRIADYFKVIKDNIISEQIRNKPDNG